MYKPSRMMSTFNIAGFQYHDGALALNMRDGSIIAKGRGNGE